MVSAASPSGFAASSADSRACPAPTTTADSCARHSTAAAIVPSEPGRISIPDAVQATNSACIFLAIPGV